MLNTVGRFKEAETYLRQAIALNPRSRQTPDAYGHLGTVLNKQGRLEESIVAFRAVIKFRPDGALDHSNLGIALIALERYDEALQSFNRALALDPTLEKVRANRKALLEAMEGNLE